MKDLNSATVCILYPPETASEGEFLSGDDTTNSSFGQSTGTAQLLKSLAEMRSKESVTTTSGTPAETSTSEGLPTETESSQDESPCRESRVKIREEDVDVKSEAAKQSLEVQENSGIHSKLDSQIPRTESNDAPKTTAPVPVALVKINPDDPAQPETMAKVSQGQQESDISDSEPEIIDLISDSDSPVRAKPPKIVKKSGNEEKKMMLSKKEDEEIKKKEVPSTIATGSKDADVTCIDLTLDSSDGDSLTSTPPRRALHETHIKAKAPSKDTSRKLLEDSGAKPADTTEGVADRELNKDPVEKISSKAWVSEDMLVGDASKSEDPDEAKVSICFVIKFVLKDWMKKVVEV